MSDITPEDPVPQSLAAAKSRVGLWAGVGAAGVVVIAAIVTFVLVVSIGVLGGDRLPVSDTAKALLNTDDLAHLSGARISSGRDTETTKYTLPEYARGNPVGSPHDVTPSKCADNLEGWMAWASLDTPSYRGWNNDVIYAAQNITVDAENDYGNNIQEARHFVTVAAAVAFMNAERGWYSDCAKATYTDSSDSTNDATFNFSPVGVNLGLDSIVEGSTDRGKYVAPHLVDAYLRNQNIVYVTEFITASAPQRGLDRVSLALLQAAATNLRGLH
jgi:hypothetical protein